MIDTISLIIKETRYRYGQTALACGAVAAAVALYAGLVTLGAGMDRETARIMRDLGFNLRIVPAATDEALFWADGYARETMPEEYVQRFATHEGLSYARVMATLQQRILVENGEFILTGIAPEISPPDQGKGRMNFTVDPGAVYLGHHAARAMNAITGSNVTIRDKEFEVARVLSESGSTDDIRIYTALEDAQAMLGLEGQINEIQAMECLCRDPDIETIDILRAELDELMPEAKIIQLGGIANAREKQRIMIEKFIAIAMPFTLAICAVWIGALAMINARDRKVEIGLWRALGYSATHVASLLIGKYVVIGVLGAAIGFAAGTALAMSTGPGIFEITAKSLQPVYPLLRTTLVAAPIFAAAAALIPAMFAATQDPADVLRDS